MNTSLLDVSSHNLNTSTSKHKFSFPKADRFGSSKKSLCDSYYEIPSTKTHRAPSFGFGNKDMGIRDDKYVPPPASYTLNSQFNQKRKGFSFGSSRQEMVLGGPLAQSTIKKYIPGPGNYKDYSTLILKDNIPSIKSRLPDRSTRHLLKNPGPGHIFARIIGVDQIIMQLQTMQTIQIERFLLQNYSQQKRLQIQVQENMKQSKQILNQMADILFQKFKILNQDILINHLVKLVYKHMLSTPSPGVYDSFSEFGAIV